MHVLISDYENALEADYGLTIDAIEKAMGEQVDARIYSYRSDEELKEVLATVDGLITGFLEIGEDILSACPNLRCISVSGVGYSNIDVEAAKRHGVIVCHIKEYCTEEVAEHALSLMMALNRNLTYYHNQLENQHLWKYDTIVGNANLSSQTLAIFGLGKIGRRVAQMARAFGMAVVAVDPYASKEDASSLGVELVSADEAFAMAEKEVSVNALDATSFKLFPNPANSTITLCSDVTKADKAVIFDSLGHKIKTVKIHSNVQAIDINNLSTGNYLIVLYHKGKSVSRKMFVKA